LFERLLLEGHTPVVAPITHDGKGQLLNTNADTIAQEIATGLSKTYTSVLIYSFEKAGVLADAGDESTVISMVTKASYIQLKADNIVWAGMIPKLDNAFAALSAGVARVIIGKAENLSEMVQGTSGTSIVNE